jgi:predicted nucleotidyltransferase
VPQPDVLSLVRRLRARLAVLYGKRLLGVLLYGSHARGGAREDSDIDVLVTLDGDVDVWTELKAMWEAPGMAEEASGRVSLHPVSAHRFARGDDEFVTTVREDAMRA